MNRIFIRFLFLEIAYVAAVRILLLTVSGLLHRELYWAGLRLISAVILILLYRQLAPLTRRKSFDFSPRYLVATAMFLAPLLVGNNGFEGADRYVFAGTAFLVGLREELAYRGILQGFLTSKLGLTPSLLISNLAFVAYHTGLQTFEFHYVVQIFLCGVIMGLVYHWSGNILFAIALHSIYDAIDSFTPFLAPPMPGYVCTIVLASTLTILLLAHGLRKTPSRSEARA